MLWTVVACSEARKGTSPKAPEQPSNLHAVKQASELSTLHLPIVTTASRPQRIR